jgi:transcriptional regulator with XRE-family HTH domain
LGRAMTQGEVVRAIREEMREADGTTAGLSQSYLSQIESGTRPHLTNTTRLLLAKFFNVHPGYLVDDPEGYHAELMSDLRAQATLDEKLDLWLIGGAERFRRDPELRRALLKIARYEDSRSCLLLLESILETPSLSERLLEVLRPEQTSTRHKTPLLVTSEPASEKSTARGDGSKGNGSNGAGSNGAKSSQGRRGGSKR